MQKRFILYAFFLLRFVSLFGTITIDIDLPGALKNQLGILQKSIQNVCFSYGCFPNMLPKDDLRLSIQLITDNDLSSEDEKKIQQVVEKVAEQIDPFNVTGNPNFGLMPYGGQDYLKWKNSARSQYQGDWVGFELQSQGNILTLKNRLIEELKNSGITVIDHKPVIAIGFTRFTEVKNATEQKKGQVNPLALNFKADSLQINKTTLSRQKTQTTDKINIKKENLGTYELGRKAMPEDALINALKILEGAFSRLVSALS